ncbi:MAG: biotin/lipoyl-containing protein, partial [Phycisphaerae bacterium]
MAIEFKVPEVSEGVTSVDVAEVKVAEGDIIEAGAVVCEVETDKAVAEINCPFGGTITAVHVKPGTTIPIGERLVSIQTTSAGSPSSASAASTPPAPAPAAAAAP